MFGKFGDAVGDGFGARVAAAVHNRHLAVCILKHFAREFGGGFAVYDNAHLCDLFAAQKRLRGVPQHRLAVDDVKLLKRLHARARAFSRGGDDGGAGRHSGAGRHYTNPSPSFPPIPVIPAQAGIQP